MPVEEPPIKNDGDRIVTDPQETVGAAADFLG